jgi:phosphoribosylanthranilate isomerase
LPEKLRKRLGPKLRILRVVHFGPQAAKLAMTVAQDPNVDAVLVDSRTAAAAGGTGVAFDWNAARKTMFGDTGRYKFIVAGGLSPANVQEAIATLRPWGVDVASGVEAAPGRKHPEKVLEFVERARAADRESNLPPARKGSD